MKSEVFIMTLANGEHKPITIKYEKESDLPKKLQSKLKYYKAKKIQRQTTRVNLEVKE